MKFKYYKFPLPKKSEIFGNTILKPIIPIEISYNENSLKYSALIDSGADFCIFHSQIGEYLGLKIKSGPRDLFSGVTPGANMAEVYFHEITLNVGGWDYKTIVGFSEGIAGFGYGLLGQKGFFDIFIVKFDLLEGEIELKERKHSRY